MEYEIIEQIDKLIKQNESIIEQNDRIIVLLECIDDNGRIANRR